MSILHRVGTTQEEREAYLRFAPWKGEKEGERTLSRRALRRAAREGAVHPHRLRQRLRQALLGLRISPHQPRRSGHHQYRHVERNGCVVASFPAHQGEQLMLVTDQGKMIRTTVGDIRIVGRNTMGVTIFRVADNEHVVSVAKIEESEEEEIEIEGGDENAPAKSGDRRKRA